LPEREVENWEELGVQQLNAVKHALNLGLSNDLVKYLLPESYKTELVWTINARSLQNFLSLRTDKSALWEIRELAIKIFEALPDDHKYLFEPFVKPQPVVKES
jgi:thymidylate synthase (FAD)